MPSRHTFSAEGSHGGNGIDLKLNATKSVSKLCRMRRHDVQKKTLSDSTTKLVDDVKTADSTMVALVKRATKQLDVVTSHNRIFHLSKDTNKVTASVSVHCCAVTYVYNFFTDQSL